MPTYLLTIHDPTTNSHRSISLDAHDLPAATAAARKVGLVPIEIRLAHPSASPSPTPAPVDAEPSDPGPPYTPWDHVRSYPMRHIAGGIILGGTALLFAAIPSLILIAAAGSSDDPDTNPIGALIGAGMIYLLLLAIATMVIGPPDYKRTLRRRSLTNSKRLRQ